MTLYWRGTLTDEPGGILEDFFSRAPADVRGHAISFVGLSVKATEGTISQAILERLTALWDQRRQQAKAPGSRNYASEMSAFGWWFVSEKFDDSWAIAQLVEALRLAGRVEVDHLVVERLAVLAPTLPRDVVQALNLMV